MSIEWILGIYVFGYIIYFLVSLEDYTRNDYISSLIVGVIWPIVMSARIVRVLLKYPIN